MLKSLIKTLCWSDSSSSKTGFGIVAKNIFSYLYNTEDYEIHQLAINYPFRFNLVNDIPWTQIPTKSLDPSEPYGKVLFLRSIAEGDYDLVWIMNDTYVVFDIVNDLKKIVDRKRAAGKKVPRFVYYYPVDCHCRKEVGAMIEYVDVPVCYNDYGRKETLLEIPEVEDKLKQIPHGVDTSVFYPLNNQEELKVKFLGRNADKFMFLNVNRNSDRKQLARCIYAFSEFKKQVPNSILLLHTQPVERSMVRTIDLLVVVNELGLSLEDDVLFPKHYELSRPYPENLMNELYNAADCFITTHLGEGWGCSVSESMAAGTPVIAPNNTAMPQLLGEYSERGYLYETRDYIYPCNAGLRPIGYTEDVVFEMFKVYRSGNKQNNQKVKLAREWAEQHDWKIICPQWDTLFKEVLNQPQKSADKDLKVIRI